MEIKRALISLYDTNNIENFAQSLHDLGWEIIATQETVNILSKHGIPVIDIESYIGNSFNYDFPPTLHPKIEAALTTNNNINSINLVYVNPYPLNKGIDVGGRTLLQLAAKGNRIPVMTETDMNSVVETLKKTGSISEKQKQYLIKKTLYAVTVHLKELIGESKIYAVLTGQKQEPLLSGQNPYQHPAAILSSDTKDPLALTEFERVSGELPCYTNMADVDCILHTFCLSSEAYRLRYHKIPYICLTAKHGNACGMAVSWQNPEESLENALFGNPRSIWGGECITNFEIDEALAARLFKSPKREKILGSSTWMFDIILAPNFTSKAVQILGQRERRKLYQNARLKSPFLSNAKMSYRFIRGGLLRQPPNNYILDIGETEKDNVKLDDGHMDTLILIWSVAWSSSLGGNETAIGKNRKLLSVGGGPSTFDAVQTAIERAASCKHDVNDALFAANAFFPFIDAPALLVEAGIKGGLVPAGGQKGKDIRNFFESKNLDILYLPARFRGFSRH